jgi:hypothetical protein
MQREVRLVSPEESHCEKVSFLRSRVHSLVIMIYSHDVAVDDIQEIDYYFHVDATMDRPPLPVLIPVDASSYTLQPWTL